MDNFDSCGADYWVLLACWSRTVQAGLPRTGDGTSVSPPPPLHHLSLIPHHIGLDLHKIFLLIAPLGLLAHSPLTSYSKVEIFKATFSPFLPIVKGLRTAPFSTLSTLVSPRTVVESIRNASRAQLAQSGVIVAEIIGFFTIGEIIGRRKLVGYRSNH